MTRPPFYPFRSEEAKAEYEAHSRETAKAWPVPAATTLFDTPAGQTFVRVSWRAMLSGEWNAAASPYHSGPAWCAPAC